MNSCKQIILLTISMFSFFFGYPFFSTYSELERTENNLNNQAIEDKIYILPSDVVFSEQGIFLFHSGDLLPIKSISYDSLGLFALLCSLKGNETLRENTCLNGHPIYHRECRGCAHWWCVFRCKCYSPWP